MVGTTLVSDGKGGYNEVYTTPRTVKDANAWLERVGVYHLRFGTSKGNAVVRHIESKRIILESDKIVNICIFLACNPVHMSKLGIQYYDWYLPTNNWGTVLFTYRKNETYKLTFEQ